MNYSRYFANLAGAVLLAAVYFGAAKLGLALAFVNASASAVWPPTGIALAAVLLIGPRAWPGIMLGAFLANLTTAGSVATSIAIAVGNTLESLVGAYLIARFARGRHAFDRTHDIFTFVILGAILSTAVSATIGVTGLCLGGFASWANYGSIWSTWWLGDAVGALVVAPPLVLWGVNRRVRWYPSQALEVVFLLLALVLMGWAMFGGLLLPGIKNYPLTFMCMPLLIWAAFQFGQREAATAAGILSGIAIWGTVHGIGPFVTAEPNEALLVLQAFIGVATATSLILAAAVSERKQVELALRESKAQIEAILQGVSDGVSVQDRSGRLVYINDVATRLIGYAPAQGEAPLAEVMQQFEIFDEAGHPFPPEHLPGRLALQGLPSSETLVRFRIRATGEERWSVIKAAPIYDQDRQPQLAINTFQDITAHKQAEAALRQAKAELETHVAERTAKLRTANQQLRRELGERLRVEGELRASEAALQASQARLAGILDIADDAIISVNERQEIILFNQGAERIFGYTAQEVIGESLDLLLPAHVQAPHHQHIHAFAASSEVARRMGSRRDIFGRRRDGSEFPAEASISKLTAADELVFTVILRDITARKQIETRLRASVREKEILLQEVHHRVKNNLQIIKSLLRLQAHTVGDPALHELLRDSQNRVHTMALVHEQLYRAADLAHVDFAAYLHELTASVLRSYEAQSARIALTCESDAVLALDIDAAIPLGLILTELVSNSLKHAFPDGRDGTITIGLHAQAETLTLTVRDDGRGLPAAFNLGTTSSLGLQLVGDLTDQLGGTVTIGRQGGTAFLICIPRSYRALR
jgi:PAS domain S-box-containing protein